MWMAAIAPSAAATMVALYGGALFTLVTGPPGPGGQAGPTAHDLARAIVAGVLATTGPPV